MDNLNDHIEKYIKGELSPAEMRDLEMKALNDPFIADALEGAESIEPIQFSEDIRSINKKIRAKEKSPYLWPLRIAASVLIVAVVYFIMVQTSNELEPKELALQKDEIPDSEPGFSLSDTIEIESKASKDQIQKLEEFKPAPLVDNKPELLTQSESPKTIEGESLAIVDDKQAADHSVTEIEADEMAMVAAAEEIVDEIIEEEKSEPSRAKMKELKKSAAQPQALSGAGARQSDTKSFADKDASIDESYQKYLNDNVKYPKEAIENNIEGTVTVSFKIEIDGSPSEFKIEKSIGYGCDEELIRLIKEGPSWSSSGSSERAIVSFAFEIKP